MLLDIIIIGKNEENTLSRVFDSVERSRMKFYREYRECPTVIYIDSNSDDNSVNIAEEYGIQYNIIKGKSNAARGRKTGADMTNSDYIFFLDGDTEVEEDWLVNGVRVLMERKDIGGIGGKLKFITYFGENQKSVNENYRGTKKDYEKIKDGVGGTFLYSRDAYTKAGGFNPDFSVCEEVNLMLRVMYQGYKVLRLNQPMAIHHDYKTSKESFLKRYLITSNIYIPGAVVRTTKFNMDTFRYIIASFGLHILYPFILVSITGAIFLKEYVLAGFLVFLYFVFNLFKKGFNAKRAIVSMITINFYSFGFYYGYIQGKKLHNIE